MNWLDAASCWRECKDHYNPKSIREYFDSLTNNGAVWLESSIDIHTACARDIDKMFWTMEKECFLRGDIFSWFDTHYIKHLILNVEERFSRIYPRVLKVTSEFHWNRSFSWHIMIEFKYRDDVIIGDLLTFKNQCILQKKDSFDQCSVDTYEHKNADGSTHYTLVGIMCIDIPFPYKRLIDIPEL